MLKTKSALLVVFSNLLLGSYLLFQISCEKKNDEYSPISKEKITGYAQKGPYINGTSVNISELNEELVPTGKNFNTLIVDNKGTFEIKDINLITEYVELKADGFYFNEINGEKSSAQLTMYALADISNINTVNVNILTHLEKSRVEYLLTGDYTFSEAKDTAQNEVLAIFNIEKDDIANSETLDISKDDEDNAILLAVSVILQGNRSVSELTELLANISTDIREDGILNSNILRSTLFNQTQLLDTTSVRENLEDRYETLGVEATIPNFEKYIYEYITKQKPFEISYSTDNVSCFGYTDGAIDMSVIGDTSPFSYEWSNGETTEDISNLSAGSYSVTVKDINNFIVSKKNIIVSEPDEIMVTANVSVSSITGNDGAIDLTISGGTPPYSYSWSNSEVSEDINSLQPGIYTVEILDSNSCFTSKEIKVGAILVDNRDGQSYKIIQIGNQWWMAENLNFGTFVASSSTGIVHSDVSDNGIVEKYCYDNNEAYCDTFGGLYDWYELLQYIAPSGTTQGICPDGWHVPHQDEWSELIVFINQPSFEGLSLKEIGTEHWRPWDCYATNETGFTALPAGFRNEFGTFQQIYYETYFWNSIEQDIDRAASYWLRYDATNVMWWVTYKILGVSVRCVKD